MRSTVILGLAIAATTVSASMTAADFAQQLFESHNAMRQKNGIAPYTCLDSQLSQLSMDHVKYEISIDDINHDGFRERCQQIGDVACGENTLYDFKDDAKAMTESWMNSPGHRKNILNGDYKHAGFAVAKGPSGKWFATAMFTNSNPHPNTCGGATPAPSPYTDAPTTKPTSKAPYTNNPLPTGAPITTTPKPTKCSVPRTPTPIPPTKKPTPLPTKKPTPAPTEVPDHPTKDPAELKDEPSSDKVKALFDSHNQERKKNGLPAFTCLNSKLSQLSATHVDYEIKQGAISHDNFSDRCKQAGNDGACGENTLYDHKGDPAVMTTSWMNSSGHRTNILNKDYNHVGFSVKQAKDGKWYATAMFTQDSRDCQ